MKKSKVIAFMAIMAGASATFAASCKQPTEAIQPTPEQPKQIDTINGIEIWGLSGTNIQAVEDAFSALTFDSTKGEIKATINRINIVAGNAITVDGKILNIGIDADKDQISAKLSDIFKDYVIEPYVELMKFNGIQVMGPEGTSVANLQQALNTLNSTMHNMSNIVAEQIDMVDGSDVALAGKILKIGKSASAAEIITKMTSLFGLELNPRIQDPIHVALDFGSGNSVIIQSDKEFTDVEWTDVQMTIQNSFKQTLLKAGWEAHLIALLEGYKKSDNYYIINLENTDKYENFSVTVGKAILNINANLLNNLDKLSLAIENAILGTDNIGPTIGRATPTDRETVHMASASEPSAASKLLDTNAIVAQVLGAKRLHQIAVMQDKTRTQRLG